MEKGDYVHIKSMGVYHVLTEGNMQIDGKWVPCVIYKDVFEVYARETKDFKLKFKRVEL